MILLAKGLTDRISQEDARCKASHKQNVLDFGNLRLVKNFCQSTNDIFDTVKKSSSFSHM